MSEKPDLIDRAEVRDGQAIVAYSRTEAAIAELRQKYQGAKYDLTTTAGDKAARGARLELVTLRATLEKKRKELKAPAVEFGRKIDSEAARLTAEIQSLETPIDAQIKADEKRRDDERRAREEAEAARKKVHTDGIAKIAGYVALAADLPAARIATGIAYLEGLDLSGFEEFTNEATETRNRTIVGLQALHLKAKHREDEEARLQAERAQQARIAAEQAETARKLREQQEELERQRAELDRQRSEDEARARAQAAREQQERETAERRQREEAEAAARADREAAALRQSSEQLQAAALPLPELPPIDNVVPMPTKAPTTPPTMKLGDVKAALAPLTIDAAGLAALGFPAAGREGAALLFHHSDLPRILSACIAHLAKVRDQLAKAA